MWFPRMLYSIGDLAPEMIEQKLSPITTEQVFEFNQFIFEIIFASYQTNVYWYRSHLDGC